MSKFNINPVLVLHPFRSAMGEELFLKICGDAKSFLGRLEDNNKGADIVSKLSATKITAKCVMTSSEGYKLQLPLNNSMSLLLRDGNDLTTLDRAFKTRKEKDGQVVAAGIQADIPEYCQDWLTQQRSKLKDKATETVAVGK